MGRCPPAAPSVVASADHEGRTLGRGHRRRSGPLLGADVAAHGCDRAALPAEGARDRESSLSLQAHPSARRPRRGSTGRRPRASRSTADAPHLRASRKPEMLVALGRHVGAVRVPRPGRGGSACRAGLGLSRRSTRPCSRPSASGGERRSSETVTAAGSSAVERASAGHRSAAAVAPTVARHPRATSTATSTSWGPSARRQFPAIRPPGAPAAQPRAPDPVARDPPPGREPARLPRGAASRSWLPPTTSSAAGSRPSTSTSTRLLAHRCGSTPGLPPRAHPVDVDDGGLGPTTSVRPPSRSPSAPSAAGGSIASRRPARAPAGHRRPGHGRGPDGAVDLVVGSAGLVAADVGPSASAARAPVWRRPGADSGGRDHRPSATPRVTPPGLPGRFYRRDPLEVAPTCSTRCSSAAAGPVASSRSRRTAAPTIPASHAFRGPTPRNADDVRPARPPLRVLHLRHALVRQRRVRRARATASRCCSGRSRRCAGSRRCAAVRPGRPPRPRPVQRPGQALPGPRPRPRLRRRRPGHAPTGRGDRRRRHRRRPPTRRRARASASRVGRRPAVALVRPRRPERRRRPGRARPPVDLDGRRSGAAGGIGDAEALPTTRTAPGPTTVDGRSGECSTRARARRRGRFPDQRAGRCWRSSTPIPTCCSAPASRAT